MEDTNPFRRRAATATVTSHAPDGLLVTPAVGTNSGSCSVTTEQESVVPCEEDRRGPVADLSIPGDPPTYTSCDTHRENETDGVNQRSGKSALSSVLGEEKTEPPAQVSRYRYANRISSSSSSSALLSGFSTRPTWPTRHLSHQFSSFTKTPSRPSIPSEVVRLIAHHATSSTLLRTLASLNKECYDIATPYLYRSVVLSRFTCSSLFWGLELPVRKERFVFRPAGATVVVPTKETQARKRRALRWVEEVVLDGGVCDVQVCESLLEYAKVQEKEMMEDRMPGAGRVAAALESQAVETLDEKKRDTEKSLDPAAQSSGRSSLTMVHISQLSDSPPPPPPAYDPLPAGLAITLNTPIRSGTPANDVPSVQDQLAASGRLPLLPNATRLVVSPDTLNGLMTWLQKHPDDEFHPLHTALPIMLRPRTIDINGLLSAPSIGVIHSLSMPYASSHTPADMNKPTELIKRVIEDLVNRLGPKRVIWHSIHSEASLIFAGDIRVEYHCTPRVTAVELQNRFRANMSLQALRETMIISAVKPLPPLLPAAESVFIGVGLVHPPEFPDSSMPGSTRSPGGSAARITEAADEKARSISIQEHIESPHPALLPITHRLPLSRMPNVLFIDSVDARELGYAADCWCYGAPEGRGRKRRTEVSGWEDKVQAPDGVTRGKWRWDSRSIEWG